MSSENSKNMLGMVDLSNVGDDTLLYIKILFKKTQRLEKENKELKEVAGIGMVGDEERKFFIQHSTKVEKENEKLKKIMASLPPCCLRLEKENKELKEVVRIGMVGERMTPTKYRDFRCECCGASEGGQVQGCDDCEIFKVSSGMWWSEAGWAVKDDE